MSSTISAMTFFWSPVSLNGSTRRADVADRVGDHDRPRLAIGFGAPLAQHQAELEEEELLEDQPALRRRAERVQLPRPACPSGGKCTSCSAVRRSIELLPRAHVGGQRIRQTSPAAAPAPGAPASAASSPSAGRSSRRPARCGRCAASLRPQARRRRAGVRPALPLRCRISYCGFCSCRPCEVSSSLPNRMTRWCGWKTSLRNGWLNQIARSEPVSSRTSISKILKRGRRVGRMPQPTTSPGNRRRHARPQRGNGLEGAAVLVAGRKAVEQVFDRGEADALQVGGAARADALHELQRRLERSVASSGTRCRQGRARYWTIVAVPVATRISRICDGQLERIVHVDAVGIFGACASRS